MGNATSSLNFTNIIEEAGAVNPSAILDSLNSHGRTLASSVSDAFEYARQDPSAVLHSLNKRGQNVVASLPVTAKEFGSSQLVADLLSVFRKNWYEAVAQFPVYRRSSHDVLFSVIFIFLQRKSFSHWSLPGGSHSLRLLSFYTSLGVLIEPAFAAVSSSTP
jgi:hypothetical protein